MLHTHIYIYIQAFLPHCLFFALRFMPIRIDTSDVWFFKRTAPRMPLGQWSGHIWAGKDLDPLAPLESRSPTPQAVRMKGAHGPWPMVENIILHKYTKNAHNILLYNTTTVYKRGSTTSNRHKQQTTWNSIVVFPIFRQTHWGSCYIYRSATKSLASMGC